MDTIASTKNPSHAFQHELDTFSTGFQQCFAFFEKSLVFFVFPSKICQLLITGEACCHFAPPTLFSQPNPKGILSQCRYTDIKHFFSFKISAPKNKPSQTRRAVTSRR
jgi:hypothetical protein